MKNNIGREKSKKNLIIDLKLIIKESAKGIKLES